MLIGDGSHPLDRQFRVGSPFGIPLYLHIILLIFMGFWILTSLVPFRPWGIALPLILLGSVYLHELGHALSSGYFGARPRRIVLHLFGGVAETPPGLRPQHRLWVIAWGPLVSLALAILGIALTPVFRSVSVTAYIIASYVAQLNMILFIFNVLPIYPLDGGQLFREWLIMRRGQTAGIRHSLPLSMACLLLMGMLSLIFQWIGIFGLIIAISLFMSNYYEYQRWQHLFTKGFWNYIWPFGGGSFKPKGNGDGGRRSGASSTQEASTGGGLGDQLFVKLNRKKAEQLMRKADEEGIFQLTPKERALLERYLDAKIQLKERQRYKN